MAGNTPQEPRTCPCKKLPLCLSSFTAAEYGDLHSLAKQGTAIVNRRDEATGYTPLHLAAQHGHVAATSLLLNLGCSVDAVMLHRTAFSGAVATLRLLLENTTKTSGSGSRMLLLAKDETFGDLRTPLHKAVAGGRYLAVQLLLDALRENLLLNEALQIKDSNQQTPLEVALEMLSRQEAERQSVARWDQVAGGVADWKKCVQLLESADGQEAPMTIQTSRQQMQVPQHLTRIDKDGCVDCTDTDGKCLTASWQAAFQAALGSSVETTLQNSRRTTTDDLQKDLKDPETVGRTTLVDGTVQPRATASIQSKGTNVTSGPQSKGILCAGCGKPSIALYPVKGRGLICKQCKRKS